MPEIIGYLKDRSGNKYKIEYVYGGLIGANKYRILDSNNRILVERSSKEKAVRELESRVGAVYSD